MIYRPHDYQTCASEFIKSHPVAAVLLDMGMGKSSITLTAINDLLFDSFEIRKVLVVGPLRIARNTWPAEIRKWDHLDGMTYSVAVGTEEERTRALRSGADVVIINRENVEWLVERSGAPFDFDMIVVDELSSFKNPQAKRFRALMKVRPRVKRIVGLTGTPSSNGLMDLFGEYKLLDMGERLGRFIGRYREAYFVPDGRSGPVVYSYRLRPGAEARIYERISDITISMKGTEYLEMPELVTAECMVYMDEAEKEKYRRMKEDLVLGLAGDEVTAGNAAALSGKLLQLANGAVYTDSGRVERIHDRKTDALEDLVEAAGGKPMLVAYWYAHDLARITERLQKLGVRFRKIDTDDSITEWNEGRVDVGLIHPASAGHGLNLQAGGNILVWFSLTWSLELYQQTVGRLWRQGQRAGTVIVRQILTAGTIDERVVKALLEKDVTQARLIAAVRAEVRTENTR